MGTAATARQRAEPEGKKPFLSVGLPRLLHINDINDGYAFAALVRMKA